MMEVQKNRPTSMSSCVPAIIHLEPRRLADLFTQSGKEDVSSFRQCITGKKDMRRQGRTRSPTILKKWKKLKEESNDLVAEDFRLLSWMEIMILNLVIMTLILPLLGFHKF